MASHFENSPKRTFVADSDLSAKQYYIVKFVSQTNNHIDLAALATDVLAGVLYNAPVSGDVADVVLRNAQGSYKVIAGGTIHVGDMITSDTAGKAVATTVVGNYILGQSIQEAVAGDIFEFIPVPARYAATS